MEEKHEVSNWGQANIQDKEFSKPNVSGSAHQGKGPHGSLGSKMFMLLIMPRDVPPGGLKQEI